MSIKTPNLDELIDLLGEVSKEDEKQKYTHEVLRFVDYFKLERGNHPVPSTLLYKLYSDWSKEPVSETAFHQELKLHFRFKQQKYYLKHKSVDISERLYKLYSRDQEKHTRVTHTQRHFESFIKFYNIQPGDLRVHSEVLFYLYNKWSFYKKGVTFTRETFDKFCKAYLPHRVSGNKGLFFMLNPSINVAVSQEQQMEIIEGLNRAQKRRRNESSKE